MPSFYSQFIEHLNNGKLPEFLEQKGIPRRIIDRLVHDLEGGMPPSILALRCHQFFEEQQRQLQLNKNIDQLEENLAHSLLKKKELETRIKNTLNALWRLLPDESYLKLLKKYHIRPEDITLPQAYGEPCHDYQP